MKRYLVLEDGTTLEGQAFGYDGDSYGELVFTTSMTGYLESITDPSYRGQILIFASPTIGNYPMEKGSMESKSAQVAGIVTREAHSVLKSDQSWDAFDRFLFDSKVPGIDLLDTRMLVRKIRERGTMRCHIVDEKPGKLAFPDPMAQDLVSQVSCSEPYEVKGNGDYRFLFVDLGTKSSLVKEMAGVGRLLVVPYNSDLIELSRDCDAVFLSNGPGDPAHSSLKGITEFIRNTAETKPVYGVCLGHQLIGLAFGGKTVKMKFGHRGSNHAVTDGKSIMITSHNHGYAVQEGSLQGTNLNVMQRDINDGTVEMMKHGRLKVMSVQYHPEASPGPHDARIYFRKITEDMEGLQ